MVRFSRTYYFCLIFLIGLLTIRLSSAGGVLWEGLKQKLEKAGPGETFRVLLLMNEQAEIRALDEALSLSAVPLAYRHQAVVEALRNRALQSQAGILQQIQEFEQKRKVYFYRSFWIINAVNLEATADVIMALGKRSDVRRIVPDQRVFLDEPVNRQPGTEATNQAEQGLKVIKAHLLWRRNITGKNVVVMSIDTGVDGSHPALVTRWRGNEPGVSISEAWFDPETGSTFPEDPDGHGTHTMGTMVGLVEANHDTIGVAFDARWIAAKTLNAGNFQSNNLAAFQWAIDPDGNPSTMDDVPAVINCSWQDPNEAFCGTTYWAAIDNVEASGIAVVFSAGNNGPNPESITAPKNRITTPVNVWATGAIDGGNPGFPVADFSSRGPSRCDHLTIKPEACAPGVNVRSAYPGGTYKVLSGTSMATPHVSGAIALLRSAFPDLSGTTLKFALLNTAVDLGEPGEDNDYGMGLIDVYAAYRSLTDSLDPDPPTNLVAYSDYRTPTSIELTWNDPDHFVNGDTLLPSEFAIQIVRDGQAVGTVNGGTERFIDTGLNDGQKYNYSIFTRLLATDSASSVISTSWIAGGSPIPTAPQILAIHGDKNQVTLQWKNPTVNVDGTPMDDFAGINLYQNGTPVSFFTRTSADTGKLDSATFSPATPEFYQWYLTAADNEFPMNESSPSDTILTPLNVPFMDDFGSAGLPNIDIWFNENAQVNDRASNPPSPPYALNLNGHPDGGDQVALRPVDLSAFQGKGILFSYFFQPAGQGDPPEVEDVLQVYFKNSLGNWILVKEYSGENSRPFVKETIDLDGTPAGGGTYFFSQFQVRFQNVGTPSSNQFFDDWFVDNIFLGLPSGVPIMEVIPTTLSDTLQQGQVMEHIFTVRNADSIGSTLNFSIIQQPSTNWLQIVPTSGGVEALQTDSIRVFMNARKLDPGVHTTEVLVSGNDPLNGEDTVNVNLMVTGIPRILTVPDSLVFSDTARIGEALSQPLQVKNVGADTLLVSQISITSSAFSVDTSQFRLPPLDSLRVTVLFLPVAEGTYEDWLIIHSNDPHTPRDSVYLSGVAAMITSVADDRNLPRKFAISQNYPNPFNPSTTIKFQLPTISHVKLEIYNTLGQRVRTLIDKEMSPGIYRIVWNARDDTGAAVASGIYILRFQSGRFRKIYKMVLLR